MHIFKGTIQAVEEYHVYMRLIERDLRQVKNIIRQRSSHDHSAVCGAHFRLDKDESTVGTTTLRKNLVDFLTDVQSNNTAEDGDVSALSSLRQNPLSELRKYVTGLERPRSDSNSPLPLFQIAQANNVSPLKGCELRVLVSEFSRLNVDQKAVLHKVRIFR